MFNNDSKKFEKFLLSEYQNIAQAHFKSIETITTFFRYYLLIMSIPLSAIAIIVQNKSDTIQFTSLINKYEIELPFVLLIISLIGVGVFWYIINLRLDAVLYARVVNGVRKFFYDQYNEDVHLKIQYRVLPQSPQLPTYVEWQFFLPVVVVFSLMNSIYFFLGLKLLTISLKMIISTALFFLLFHFALYKLVSWFREISYLKSNILGIDIDGVLNYQCEQFCRMLKNKTGKEIKPNQILMLPINEQTSLNVSREDERKIFNDPKYWMGLAIRENISEKITKLKNISNLKIFIFTYGPWPDIEEKQELIEITKEFYKNTQGLSPRLLLLKIGIILNSNWLVRKFKEEPLKLITTKWLRDNNILFNKLILEKGNDYSLDTRSRINNRFHISRKKKIRFFIEDDCEKAVKLSYICDIVYLISHPYNQPYDSLPDNINNLRRSLPSNIIKVENWNEIYQNIRLFS